MRLPPVCDIRSVIKDALKLANEAEKNGDFEKAKFYWRRATNAANAIADIDESDKRWKVKCEIIDQIFDAPKKRLEKMAKEQGEKRIEEEKLNLIKIAEEEERKKKEKIKEEIESEKKRLEEKKRKDHLKWIINRNKSVCSFIESKLADKKDEFHLFTVRQIGKQLLKKGDVESYRVYKVLHSAARRAATWHNFILAIKDDQKEIDRVADLTPVKEVINFLKREIVIDSEKE